MNFICKNWKGTLLCLVIALPCWWLDRRPGRRGMAAAS